MKTKYFKYLWFVVILGLFVFSMFTIRMKTKTDIQDRIYQKWEKHFVVKKGNEAYVKTTNDKDKDVVLSESQSYGMQSPCEQLRKVQLIKKILKDSTSIICHIVLKAIN